MSEGKGPLGPLEWWQVFVIAFILLVMLVLAALLMLA
jgi:hypothetical protein